MNYCISYTLWRYETITDMKQTMGTFIKTIRMQSACAVLRFCNVIKEMAGPDRREDMTDREKNTWTGDFQ